MTNDGRSARFLMLFLLMSSVYSIIIFSNCNLSLSWDWIFWLIGLTRVLAKIKVNDQATCWTLNLIQYLPQITRNYRKIQAMKSSSHGINNPNHACDRIHTFHPTNDLTTVPGNSSLARPLAQPSHLGEITIK